MADFARKTIRHATIYGIGIVMGRIASFVMLPIYTRFLSPADYGVIELLTMTIDFVSVLLGLRVAEAIFRFYMTSDDPENRKDLISTALLAVLAVNAAGVLLLILFAHPLTALVLGANGRAGLLQLFALSLLFAGVGETVFVFIRAEQRPWLFVIFSTVRLILQLALSIYFVVLRRMHVEGVIYSAVLSGGISCVALGAYTVSRVGLRWSAAKARELISFSWPLMLSSIGAFYITFGDRFFLRAFSTMNAVGLYSLAYKFAFLLVALLWTPFANIWDSERYEICKRDDAKQTFGRVFALSSYLLIATSLVVGLFASDVLQVMAAPGFWGAARMVPLLLAAYVIQCWTGYANLGIMLSRDTKHITYATFLSVVVITIAYSTLIPRFGGMGAAWATLAGMVARFVWVYKTAKARYDMELPWRPVIQLAGLALLSYAVAQLAPAGLIWSIAIHTSVLVGFVILSMTRPILDKSDREALTGILRRPAGAMRALATGRP